MKTAISVPDATFEQVETKAHELGWTRSRFYTTAAQRLLDDLSIRSRTDAINAMLEHIGETDDSARAAAAAGRVTLAREGHW